MSRASSKRAPKGAAEGVSRPPRQRGEVPRGKEWVRPYKRAQRALDAAASLIMAAIYAVAKAGLTRELRPLRTAHELTRALWKMTAAQLKLEAAKRDLAEASAAFAREPELTGFDAFLLLEMALERSEKVQAHILLTSREVLAGATDVMGGIATGELVEEKENPFDDRPAWRRIVIRHRPLFVRAFLAARRQPRVGDRITPVLRRRRRTPCPAEVRVPRRNLRGRAPPLSSACSL